MTAPFQFKYPYQTPEPLDNIVLASDGEALTGLWFDNEQSNRRRSHNAEEKLLPVFRETIRWLDSYFSGKPPDWIPKYRIDNMTPFRRDVFQIMQSIPFGQTMTYGEIARQIAQKRNISKMSAQAVGNAVGWNPICIILPCHRVMGSNHKLTGYGGGIQNKIALLQLEGHDVRQFALPAGEISVSAHSSLR